MNNAGKTFADGKYATIIYVFMGSLGDLHSHAARVIS
jgi:hypothetical protein